MRRTRLVLALLVLAALVAGAAKVAGDAGRSGRGTAHGSSFRPDEGGLHGAFVLLGEVGFRVESRRTAALPEGTGSVLLRVEGGPQAREKVAVEEAAEAEALAAWAARGNAILFLADSVPRNAGFPVVAGTGPKAETESPNAMASRNAQRGQPLSDLFGARRVKVPEASGDEVEVVLPEGVDPPVLTGEWKIAREPGDVVLLRRGDDVVAAERRIGDGRVVVVADPWFATNVRLGNVPANAGYLAALVARLCGRGAVWFDDRAAGEVATRGVLSLFGDVGLGSALAAGFLLLLLVAWRAAPSDAPDRFVRPDVEYHPEVLAFQRGDLYAGCATVAEARRIVEGEVARRLGRGDGSTCDRALALLAARDPERAARIRAAVDDLPTHPAVTPTRHPETWCAAIADLWAAMEERNP